METDRADTIEPGMKESINMFTDNTQVLFRTKLLDDSFPKSPLLFGSGIRMRIGRFVKANFIRDFDYVGDAFEFELANSAINGSSGQLDISGTTTFHVKESRMLM